MSRKLITRNWREMLASAAYRTGGLRMLEYLARSYELRMNAGQKLPRWQRGRGAKYVILCYHRVGTEGIPLYSSLSPEVFDAQMSYLREHYRVISLAQLISELERPDATGQAAAVTFDDGYRDNYSHAFPVLQKYGIPATIFLTVGAVESGEVSWYDRVFLALQILPSPVLHLDLDVPRRYELKSPQARYAAAVDVVARMRKLPEGQRRQCCADLQKKVTLPARELSDRMLTWDQVRTMHQSGVSFGSHTVTHPVLSQLTTSAAEMELRDSKRILEERIESAVEDFAFPFGQPADCGDLPAAALARCGYRSAVTTSAGVNRPGADPYRLRRVQIGDGSSVAMFAFQLNQLFLRAEQERQQAASEVCSRAEEEILCSSGSCDSEG